MSDDGSPVPAIAPVFVRAVTLGVVAGMRAVMPLALLAAASRRDAAAGPAVAASLPRPLAPLRWPGAAPLTTLAAAELVGDKLPIAPSRLSPPQISARLVVGALAGATIYRAGGRSPLVGAAVGAAAAGAGALAGYTARTRLGRVPAVPVLVWALAEDGIAFRLGRSALRRLPAGG